MNLDVLERLLAGGQESPVLRFSLGSAYLPTDAARAVTHFTRAIELKPDYSAAWKMLGAAQTAAGNLSLAIEAYARGIEIAQKNGDVQAAKEMGVFLRRAARTAALPSQDD